MIIEDKFWEKFDYLRKRLRKKDQNFMRVITHSSTLK